MSTIVHSSCMFGTIIEHRVKAITLCDVRGTILSEFSHIHIHNFLDRNNVRLLAKTYQLTMYIALVNFSVFRAYNRGGNCALSQVDKFLLRSLSTLLQQEFHIASNILRNGLEGKKVDFSMWEIVKNAILLIL